MRNSFLFYLMIGSLILPLNLGAAELRSTLGTVEVQKAGSGVWSQGRPKTEIGDGDLVRTGVSSQAELKMRHGHNLTLREKSTLKLDSQDPRDTRFNLLIGRVRTFVNKLGRQNKFEIKTPIAVASIRGTLFELEVAENEMSRLSVLEGVVSYRDLAGIGAEVQVLKGQSVVVEPGAAPKPAESLPQDLQQGLAPEQQAQPSEVAAALKMEIQRETGLASFKEFFQADAAQEMKIAQYQEGKTLIDAFGKRVRLEEYIVRPDPKQWSFVALNTREDRFDFTRYDLYAQNALPEDISTVNLFSSNSGAMSNWLVKTHRLTSNGGDYYREWQDGGTPANSGTGQKVYFDNWYVEVKAQDGQPVLLSHWTKDIGNTNSGVPAGYKNYGTGTIGDSRPIDTFTATQRLNYFSDSTVSTAYSTSEGYSRSQVAMADDKTSYTLTEALNATKVSSLLTYDVPGSGTDITLRVDSYKIRDDGDRLNVAEQMNLGSNVEGINYQDVMTGSLLGNRKIDVVISPSILKKAGLLN